MIIEPVPTLSRSRRHRIARLLGLVMPAGLLVLVIAGGLLGSPAGTPTGTPPADTASTPGASPARAVAPIAPAIGVPTVIADLGVRTVPQALAVRGQVTIDDVLAVSGSLSVAPAMCPGAEGAGLGPLCERRGTLVDPSAVTGTGPGAPSGPHLDVRMPAGVALPDTVTNPPAVAGTVAAGGAVPVVLVGRFETGGETCPTRLECNVDFLVDQVPWVDGTTSPATLVIDTGIDAVPAEWILVHQRDAEVAAVGRSGILLVTALLRPETVARVDPTAAAALHESPPPTGLVWYVRGLETDYDPTRYPLGQSTPRLSWALLDDVTGDVIARGLGALPAQSAR
jgi:hypothetical protein